MVPGPPGAVDRPRSRRVTVSRMSERPHDRPSTDPANTQMFRAFVERGAEEDTGRRWVLPAVLVAVLAIVAVVVLLVALS